MREFKYIVTAEDIAEGLDIRTILRRRFTFSARLRSKIKRNRTVYRNGYIFLMAFILFDISGRVLTPILNFLLSIIFSIL